ncbi:acetyl-CoA acetyltransferase [Rhodococcus rhodochrous]|nr:acetyl-CoA acetyltransferase [Rhodococcus rhodochrous]
MPDAIVTAAVRTAIGTAFKGSLANVQPDELAVPVITAAMAASGVSPDLVDDVILAESLHGGGDIARFSAIEAGLASVPGLAVNRHCAGSLSSVMLAAAGVRGGGERSIIAGGVQSTSTAPILRLRENPDTAWLFQSHRPTTEAPADDMSITVGWNAARLAGISRQDQDAWALRSHRRALAAIEAGVFKDEIVPLSIPAADGGLRTFDTDEHPRASTDSAKLAALRVLHPEIPDFSVTAGNSSGINDAAAALMITSSHVVESEGLQALAVIRGGASVGVDPVHTGLAVSDAIRKVLSRTGISTKEVDLWEINEAFASVPIAVCRALDLDEDIVNPFGSGCSLGHPVAATGARMLTTLVHELGRRGGGTGVAAMCAGGGMASAVVVEVLS